MYEKNNHVIEDLFWQIKNALDQGNLDAASHLVNIANSYGHYPQIAQMDFLCSLAQGDIKRAKKILAGPWKSDLKEDEYHVRKAEIYMFEENFVKVIEHAQKTILLDQEHEQALHLLTMAHFQKGEIKRCIHYHELFMKLCPDEDDAKEFYQFLMGQIQ